MSLNSAGTSAKILAVYSKFWGDVPDWENDGAVFRLRWVLNVWSVSTLRGYINHHVIKSLAGWTCLRAYAGLL